MILRAMARSLPFFFFFFSSAAERDARSGKREKGAPAPHPGDHLYLVTANGGAYPKDRKTLHWSVLKVFQATYGTPWLFPTQTGTVRGLNALEKAKLIKTGSVAIQPTGTWKQYDPVYLPKRARR